MDLAENFRRWGEQGIRRLPLYGRISLAIAADPEVRDLMLEAPVQQRNPVLLFAAVHDLLLRGADHRLAQRYPTVGGSADAPDDPYPDFRDFVLSRRPEVTELVATRNTQTNEVGRCSVLRPSWGQVAEETRTPLGLIELGASAGLNLLLDQWAYSYTPNGPACVEAIGGVLVEAETRGDQLPPLGPLPLGSRMGIDLHPVDVHDEESVRWLLACIWAEQLPRFKRLKAAIDVARRKPPEVIAGDLVETLPSAAARAPAEEHLAVQNSWVLNYLSQTARQQLMAVLDGLGAVRDLSWLSVENPEVTPDLIYPPRPDGRENSAASVAVLTTWRSGHKAVRRIADCHPHGAWLRWW